MLLKIGAPKLSDFSDPIGVLTGCHRRIEDFLSVLETGRLERQLADIDPVSKNIAPEEIRRRITPKTRALLIP